MRIWRRSVGQSMGDSGNIGIDSNNKDSHIKDLNFEQSFDINDVTFSSVNRDFERKFRERYRNSLELISDNKDRLRNASGANTLGILEKMAQRIDYYDKTSNFEESYSQLVREYEPFTET